MVSISGCGYIAVIHERGAELVCLRFEDRDLVVPCDTSSPNAAYRGSVLAPWPNRLADGRYSFDGVDYRITVNEPGRNTALHGLVYDAVWTVTACGEHSCQLTTMIDNEREYPSRLALTIRYSLGHDGLTVSLEAINEGRSAAPYGCSIHPYLIAGGDPLDEWTLEFSSREVQHVDSERLLPTELGHVTATEFDFNTPRKIGATEIDNAFRHAGDVRELTLTSPSGTGVTMSWSNDCAWVQLHTADRPGRELHRAGLAVEPMTCPPDAFNTGIDLLVLAPDARHKTVWRIAAG